MPRKGLVAAVIVLLGLGSLVPAQLGAAPAAAPAAASANLNSPLGTNSDYFRYYSSELLFQDAFKQSRQWLTRCIPGQQPDCTGANSFDTGEEALLDLDADGSVRSLPRPQDPPIYWFVATTMFNFLSGHYPPGQYVVLYDGTGTIVYSGDATKNIALSA